MEAWSLALYFHLMLKKMAEFKGGWNFPGFWFGAVVEENRLKLVFKASAQSS